MHFSSFKLDDRLQKAIKAAGFTDTTPIQEAAIPPALKGRDIIGTAQTGTGKTAAFVLPILQSLLDKPGNSGRTRVLIITPTRELAEQVSEAINELGRYTKIRSATVYGGVAMDKQVRALRKGTEIIVACPGRLLDHMRRGNANLKHIETLVLDEGDRMLDMGFLPSVRDIVAKTPDSRQTMLFSATFAPELGRLAQQILDNPERIEIGLAAPPNTVTHTLCPVAQTQKTKLLLQLLEEHGSGSVLIFTRTKHRANRVAQQIERSGLRATALHSNKTQSQRQKALDGFRSGKYRLLVATDIAARGLDIDRVSCVINYDIPDTPDAYIHRIGRTGRAERDGSALTLVTADDHSTVRSIERALGEAIAVREFEGFDYGAPTMVMGSSGRGGGSRGSMTSFRSSPSRPRPGGNRSGSRRSGRR